MSSNATFDTLPARLFSHAQHSPQAPAYQFFQDGSWHSRNWAEFANEVHHTALAMIGLNVERGQIVGLLGQSNHTWTLVCMAALSIGAIPALLHPEADSEDFQQLLYSAECAIILVEQPEHLTQITPMRPKLPLLRQIVMTPGYDPVEDPQALSWEAFLACGEAVSDGHFDRRFNKVAPEHLALYSFVYNSKDGSKASMVSHQNMTWTATQLQHALQLKPHDHFLLTPPLAHPTNFVASLCLSISTGASATYANVANLWDALKTAQPTVIIASPAFWKQLAALAQKTIEHLSPQSTQPKPRAMQWAEEVSGHRLRSTPLPVPLWLKHVLAHPLTLNKMKAALGLQRARYCAVYHEPLGASIQKLFSSISIPVYRLYGDSRTSGVAFLTYPQKSHPNAEGLPLPEAKFDIEKDGKVALQGPNAFLGYHKDNKTTSAILKQDRVVLDYQGECNEQGFFSMTSQSPEHLYWDAVLTDAFSELKKPTENQ